MWGGGDLLLFLFWGEGSHIRLHGVIQVSNFVLTSQKTIKDTVFLNLIICGLPKTLIGGKVRSNQLVKNEGLNLFLSCDVMVV